MSDTVAPMRALAILFVTACGASSPRATAPTPQNAGDAKLASAIDAFLTPYFAFRPTFGVELGLHEYDGQVPDRSPAAIQAEIARLHAANDTFGAFAPATLSKQRQVEREVVLTEIHKEL